MSPIENPNIIEIPSSYRDEFIRLEYRMDEGQNISRKLGVRYEEGVSQSYKIVEGNKDLPSIIQSGIWSQTDSDELFSPGYY